MDPKRPSHTLRPTSRRHYFVIPLVCLLIGYGLFSYLAVPSVRQVLYQPLPKSAPFPCDRNEPVKRVAIIGAGSAGASTAYYLNEYTQGCNRVNVTVYERTDYIGGRSTTVNAYDSPAEPVELGASIFVKVNRNLVTAVRQLGLSTESFDAGSVEKLSNTLGVYNGEEWVYWQSSNEYKWWTSVKLLWKYGMAPIQTQNLMKETTGKFFKMYDAPFFPFQDLSQTVYDVGLTDAMVTTGEQYLKQNNIAPSFSTDIIQASTRVNYAQNLDTIHGVETMVCMATNGAMAVRGGNWQIFAGMLKASGATVHLNTSVTSIAKMSDGAYHLTSKLHPAQDTTAAIQEEESANYDTIILATPLQFANVTLTPGPLKPPPSIPYVHLHVTLFTSPHKLNPLSFNLPPSTSLPKTILTTPDPDGRTPAFFSISTLRALYNPATQGKEYVYKIFSPERTSSEFIASILASSDTADDDEEEKEGKGDVTSAAAPLITWILRKEWDSYPVESPRVTFEDIWLREEEGGDDDGDDEAAGGGGLWYTAGIEGFISTMETSSLMGMNVARLVSDGWRGGGGGDREAGKAGNGSGEREAGEGGEL